jgi:Fe2+ or Zn2+ uptake regulation protein
MSSPRAPRSESDPAEELARRGLRATRQRLAVLRMLRQRPGHHTALDVHRRLLRQHPTLSQKTVYEILDALVAAGLAARVAHGGGPARYELRQERHYHAQCRVCGLLEDVPASADGPIRGHAIVPTGFRIEEIHVTIEGCCVRCAREARA